MVNEFDLIGEAEFMYGGNWVDYHLSESTGDLGKIYDPTLNIFKEPMPVDIVGIACSSWTQYKYRNLFIPCCKSWCYDHTR